MLPSRVVAGSQSRGGAAPLLVAGSGCGLFRFRPKRKGAFVDSLAKPRNRLESKGFGAHFHEHERTIDIERGSGELAAFHVAFAKLRCAARGEIVDPLLRLDPLVEVLMAGKD